jgi:hypothetical protein
MHLLKIFDLMLPWWDLWCRKLQWRRKMWALEVKKKNSPGINRILNWTKVTPQLLVHLFEVQNSLLLPLQSLTQRVVEAGSPSGEKWPRRWSSLRSSKLFYNRRSVGQCKLVSRHHLGPTTNSSFSSIKILFRYFRIFLIWRPLAEDRTHL